MDYNSKSIIYAIRNQILLAVVSGVAINCQVRVLWSRIVGNVESNQFSKIIHIAKKCDRIALLVVVCGLDLRCLGSGTYTRDHSCRFLNIVNSSSSWTPNYITLCNTFNTFEYPKLTSDIFEELSYQSQYMMSHKMSDLLAILPLLKTHFTRFSYHLGIHKPRKSTNSFKAIRSNSDSVHLHVMNV